MQPHGFWPSIRILVRGGFTVSALKYLPVSTFRYYMYFEVLFKKKYFKEDKEGLGIPTAVQLYSTINMAGMAAGSWWCRPAQQSTWPAWPRARDGAVQPPVAVRPHCALAAHNETGALPY